MKAIYQGQVLAESSETHKVDGYFYFPRSTVNMSLLEKSDFSTRCPAKGSAVYWNVSVKGSTRANAAFCYPETLPDMKHIEGWIGFWTGDREDDVHIVE